MDVPFHRVKVCGDILVAARGASIHTFNALNGAHVATWRLPRQAGKDDEGESKKKGNGSAPPTLDASATPPPKRRRLESAAVADAGRASQDSQDAPSSSKDPLKTRKNKKNVAAAAVTAALRSGDLPVVSILESTADGRHVIAVMGHDKTVRVLTHDLQGHLEQISQRTVPKRPSAVAITADGQTILVGDKFGDVYALPLIETEDSKKSAVTTAEEGSGNTPAASAASTVTPLQLKANSFTVHTKGNLQALENQRRQKELSTQRQSKQNPHDAADYRLLLGHVSMLTALVVAEAVPVDARPGYAGDSSISSTTSRHQHQQSQHRRCRPLILTADRDEHIRVTRGVIGTSPQTSQTHVIETFCLGHKSFVSRMCVAARRPDRLVSAGGDGELRVWDFWPSGQTVGAAALGPLVEATAAAAEEKDDSSGGSRSSLAPRVAVSGLYSFADSSAGDLDAAASSIVAICERVPALFFFVLEADGNALTHTQTLRLPGLPLDVGISASGGHVQLIVAVATTEAATGEDTNASASLLIVARDDVVQSPWTVADARLSAMPEEAEHSDTDVDPVALRHLLLFGTESLRKADDEAGGE